MRRISRCSRRAPKRAALPCVWRGARWLLPFIASPFLLDLACQVFLASIGALSLMLLTGYAGQISLGHAGLLAAGAFTAGILFREIDAPFWLTLPAAALAGAVLGVIFGLPSLRLRGLYLAVSHAGAAFRRRLSRWRIRDQARLLHRHHDRSAERSAASR